MNWNDLVALVLSVLKICESALIIIKSGRKETRLS
jgi:hypothetical protein